MKARKSKVLTYEEVHDHAAMAQRVEEGLPVLDIVAFGKQAGFTTDELASLIRIPPRTYARRIASKSRLKVPEGERAVRINMSIPTDSEEVRQAFEPKAPPLERRWQAIADARAAGVPVGICVTPMLPLRDPDAFVKRLVDFNPDGLVTQDFHDSGGGFGADTGEKARTLLARSPWSADAYRRCVEEIATQRKVYEGEEGFFPPE